MQNGNEAWHILKSIYDEKTQIIVFKMTDQLCWCQQKLIILQKCLLCLKSCFNYIAINDNKTTNNYPRPFNRDLLTNFLTPIRWLFGNSFFWGRGGGGGGYFIKNWSNISITCRKDVTYDNIIITKEQDFTLSLEDTFF